MIRLILRRKMRDQYSGLESDFLYTLDVDCPSLEAHLMRGGTGEHSYDVTQLVDAEVIKDAP